MHGTVSLIPRRLINAAVRSAATAVLTVMAATTVVAQAVPYSRRRSRSAALALYRSGGQSRGVGCRRAR